jgi:hypothetical protein
MCLPPLSFPPAWQLSRAINFRLPSEKDGRSPLALSTKLPLKS